MRAGAKNNVLIVMHHKTTKTYPPGFVLRRIYPPTMMASKSSPAFSRAFGSAPRHSSRTAPSG